MNIIKYQNKQNCIDCLKSYCHKLNIDESDYIACTLIIEGATKKDIYLKIQSFSFPFIGTIEWTDKNKRGFHFHFVTSSKYKAEIESLGVHISEQYKSLNNWISYISKEDVVKEILKYKYVQSNDFSIKDLVIEDRSQQIDQRAIFKWCKQMVKLCKYLFYRRINREKHKKENQYAHARELVFKSIPKIPP